MIVGDNHIMIHEHRNNSNWSRRTTTISMFNTWTIYNLL